MNDVGTVSHNGSSLIVTGSSAGGIAALRSLLSSLPAGIPAAVVIAQHLDPSRESHLGDILRQHSALKLTVVKGRQQLQDGTVYVVPPNNDVGIVDHAANLYLETRAGAKPSIDRLFSTASEVYGDRVIAIVLSGMGSDGLAGARRVKERGGTVIVQDPASASYPSLPLLIPPNVVDFVSPPDQMGAIIAGLLRRTEVPEAEDEQGQIRALLAELRDRTGIDFTQYKMPTIMRRLSRLMVATGCETLPEYTRYLQRNPDAYQKLTSAFLIKVTEFFRDPPLYEELQNNILPRLMEEAAQNGGELRIWSAGSSTGEEAYSLAMLCAELGADEKATVRIFATDIDEDAISFSRRGVYGEEAIRDVPAHLVQRYFVHSGESYEVAKRIRNMTVFGQHDLAQRAPFPRIDLVLCRNVLIYFTKELQARALQLFAFALRDRGFLVLGRAESTTPLAQFFQISNAGLKIYQRIGERIVMPPARFKESLAVPELRAAPHTVITRAAGSAARLEFPPSAAETVGRFLFASKLGVVVVDRHYDIVTLNSTARAMLQIHGIGVGDDLIHAAEGVEREPLRSLIDSAFGGEPPEPLELKVATSMNETRVVKVITLDDPTAAGRTEGVALILLDVTDAVTKYHEIERTSAAQVLRLEEVERRLNDLSQRQKALLKANDDLTMANADLRTANEQLLINAEEAASSHEEVEILNEEMQATNEELETLNEELQATVEELNTTNDELQSRSAELETSGTKRESRLSRLQRERDALARLLESRGELVAIYHEDGALLYASPALRDDGVLSRAKEMSSKEPVRLQDGRSFHVARSAIELDGTKLRAISLKPA